MSNPFYKLLLDVFFIGMPKAGLEPAHLSVMDFESIASTNSTIRAC